MWTMTTATALGSDQEFSERVVVLLWRHRKTNRWLASKLGIHEDTVTAKMRGRHRNRWLESERELVAATLGTTLDRRGLPRLDSNQQPADHRYRAA